MRAKYKYSLLLIPDVALVALLLASAVAVSQQPAPPTGALLGIVTTHEGLPAAGANVQLIQQDYDADRYEGPGPNTLRRETSADDNGAFIFDRLPDGTCKVQAFSGNLFGVRTGHVGQGQPRRIEMDIAPAASVSGIVLDENGDPVPNAEVYPYESTQENVIPLEWTVLWRTSTNADGRFTVSPVDYDHWRLMVRAPGFPPVVSDMVPPNTSDLRISLHRGVTLVVQVLDHELQTPVPDVPIRLESRAHQNIAFEAHADDSGAARFEAILEGAYHMSVQHELLTIRPENADCIVNGNSQSETLTLELVPGAVVTGRVFDADSEEGLAGVKVYGGFRESFTDAEGRYELSGLAEGQVYVNIESPERYTNNYMATTRRVQVIAGETFIGEDFPLSRGVMVTGRVVDGDGRPVPSINVQAQRDPEYASALSGPDGNFTLPNTPIGEGVQIRAEGVGWIMDAPAVQTIAAESSPELQLTVVRSASILGRVLLPTGDAIDEGYVYAVRQAADEQPDRSRIGPGGVFRFYDIPPGHYALHVSRNRHSVATEGPPVLEIDVAPGETRRALDVTLPDSAASPLSGTVVDRDGTPIPGAALHLMSITPEGNPIELDTLTDPEGRFRFAGLPAENCHLYVHCAGYAESREQNIPSGTEDVVITLDPGASITGQVVEAATGQPVTAFELQWFSAPRHSAISGNLAANPTRVDGNGMFTVDDISAGDTTVVAAAPGFAPAAVLVEALQAGEARKGLVLALEPGYTLTGRLLDSRGNPLSYVQLRIGTGSETDASLDLGTNTIDDGSFTFAGVRPEQTLLTIDCHEKSRYDRHVQIPYPGEGDFTFDPVFLEDGAIRVEVVSQDPLPQLYVGARNLQQKDLQPSVETQGAGTFLIKGLVPGPYFVWLSTHPSGDPPPDALATRQVVVVPDALTPVQFRLRTVFQPNSLPSR